MQNFTSSTTTNDPTSLVVLKNRTHYIFVMEWEYAKSLSLTVGMQNSPLIITARGTDGINHYSTEVKFQLQGMEIATLADSYFDVLDGQIRVHVPIENVHKKVSETLNLPRKYSK